MVWKAIESLPPGLQPGALPFELPNLGGHGRIRAIKKPGCQRHRALKNELLAKHHIHKLRALPHSPSLLTVNRNSHSCIRKLSLRFVTGLNDIIKILCDVKTDCWGNLNDQVCGANPSRKLPDLCDANTIKKFANNFDLVSRELLNGNRSDSVAHR